VPSDQGLTGHTLTYAEKLAAEKAAQRVYGVKAVANDLQVRLPGSPPDDADIATAIAHTPDWNVQIPAGQVQARVQNGWVTPEGHVDYDFQRHEVERMVRHVRGVVGATNAVTIAPPVIPDRVEEQIERHSSARPKSTRATSGWRRPITRSGSTGRQAAEQRTEGKSDQACLEGPAPGMVGGRIVVEP
jgi:hypothetical protein